MAGRQAQELRGLREILVQMLGMCGLVEVLIYRTLFPHTTDTNQLFPG